MRAEHILHIYTLFCVFFGYFFVKGNVNLSAGFVFFADFSNFVTVSLPQALRLWLALESWYSSVSGHALFRGQMDTGSFFMRQFHFVY